MKDKSIRKKKGIALVFGAPKEYSFVLANVLIGLVKHNKKFWDSIVVYHDGITEFDRKCLGAITSVKFVDLSDSVYSGMIKSLGLEGFGRTRLYKFECLNLLKEYRRVIWNDLGILIRGDISKLVENAGDAGMALLAPSPQFVVGSGLRKLDEKYEMFRPLWDTRTMVLTDDLVDYEKIYSWCIDTTLGKKNDLLLPDSVVLNLMLQEFLINPQRIDPEKYACSLWSESADEAMVLHVDDKYFWNNLEAYQKYPEWVQNAIRWSQIIYDRVKDKRPLVSCIMSCYERYDYLIDSLNSLLSQTYANFELIIVLEKSKSQEKIEKIITSINDDRIIIIKNVDKLGFPASLNVGLDIAKGKYIARMDDDDLSVPQRFEKQVEYMENNAEVGIVGGNMIVFGRVDTKFLTFGESKYIRAAALFYSPFMHPTVMMRKSVLDEYDLRYDPKYFTEDYELWSRAVHLFETANLKDYLVFYRLHTDQATGDSNESKIHFSHKKVMKNQLKKYLNLDLTENEIETIQPRRDFVHMVADIDGAIAIRERTIRKVLDANRECGAYDERALEYIISGGSPDGVKSFESDNEMSIMVSENKTKKRLKSIIKPIIKPVYGKFVGKMEAMMMAHDEELRSGLQNQIDAINRERKNNEE